MRIDPASDLLGLGQLEVIETYSFHDFPRFYSTVTENHNTYVIAVCIDDDEDEGTADFLYLILDREAFALTRSGGIPLREAMRIANPRDLWKIRWTFTQGGIDVVGSIESFPSIPESDLPEPNARIQLPTPTAPAFDPVRDVADRAADFGRTVVAIELESADVLRTEFPMKWLGQIQEKTQELIYAVGQEESGEPTARGNIPRYVTNQLEMNVLPLTLAASYVFLFSPSIEYVLAESPLVRESVYAAMELVTACSTGDIEEIQSRILQRGPRVRGHFVDLLRVVESAHSSFAIFVSSDSERGFSSARLDRAQVIQSRAAIEAIEPSTDSVVIERGILLGFDVSTGSFHIVDAASGNSYRGGSSPDMLADLSRVEVSESSFVTAELERSSAVPEPGDFEPRTYTLIKMWPRSDDVRS